MIDQVSYPEFMYNPDIVERAKRLGREPHNVLDDDLDRLVERARRCQLRRGEDLRDSSRRLTVVQIVDMDGQLVFCGRMETVRRILEAMPRHLAYPSEYGIGFGEKRQTVLPTMSSLVRTDVEELALLPGAMRVVSGKPELVNGDAFEGFWRIEVGDQLAADIDPEWLGGCDMLLTVQAHITLKRGHVSIDLDQVHEGGKSSLLPLERTQRYLLVSTANDPVRRHLAINRRIDRDATLRLTVTGAYSSLAEIGAFTFRCVRAPRASAQAAASSSSAPAKDPQTSTPPRSPASPPAPPAAPEAAVETPGGRRKR